MDEATLASFPHMTYLPDGSSRELLEGHQTSKGEYVTVPKLRQTSSDSSDGHHDLERFHRHRKHSHMSHQHMNHYSQFRENFNPENYPKIDPLNSVTPSTIKHGKYYYANIPEEGNIEKHSSFNSVELRDKEQRIFKQDLEAMLQDFYEKLRMSIENKNKMILPKDDNQVNKEHRESFINKKSKLKPAVDLQSIETSSTDENSDITNAKEKFNEIIIVKKPNLIDFSPTTDATNKLDFIDIVKGSGERDITEPPLVKASTDKTSYIYVKGSYQTESSVKTEAPDNLITIVKRKKLNKTKIPRLIRTPRL